MSQHTGEIIITCAADIEPRIVEWLWRDRIPLGKLTMFYGLPGGGKSSASVDIIARGSRGDIFPDRPPEVGAFDSVVLATEDDLNDTYVPRLMAAGADRKRVFFVEGMKFPEDAKKQERQFSIDSDCEAIEKALKNLPNGKLIVMDPVSAYLGGKNRDKDADVRPILQKLKTLAENTGAAILMISHFNKNSDHASIHRITGASAWGEIPRSLWRFVPNATQDDDPDDVTEHLMLNAKLNLTSATKARGLKYEFVDQTVTLNDGKTTTCPTIHWLGPGSLRLQSDKRKGGREPVNTSKAMQWLEKYLTVAGDAGKPKSEIISAAEAAGYKRRMIDEAKAQLRDEVESYLVGGICWWRQAAKESDIEF